MDDLMNPYQLLTYSTEVGAAGLYQANVQGAWYDPSNLSTLFQDSAFTVPVTAVEQPVGGMLDLSGRGNHATQSTTTKRPVYSRRVNLLLTGSEGGLSTYSNVNNGTESAFPGCAGGVRLGLTGHLYKAFSSVQLNVAYKFSFFVRVDSGGPPTFANAGTTGVDANIILNNAYQGAPVTVVDIGGGTYSVSVTATVDNVTSYNIFGLLRNSASREIVVTGYDLRLATDAHLPYQWVNTATDYDADPAKFPAYLRFDGVDDALQTGNIDFTSTDKMTVWAGVTKIGDAVRNPIIEVGGYGVAQGFGLYSSPQGTTNQMQAFHAAANPVYVYAAATPPNANYVLGLQSDLSAPKIAMRRSGAAAAESTASPGVGAYGNLPASIGSGTTGGFYFNGRLYSLIVRGAQTQLSQIEATELYIKQKMRLP